MRNECLEACSRSQDPEAVFALSLVLQIERLDKRSAVLRVAEYLWRNLFESGDGVKRSLSVAAVWLQPQARAEDGT